MVENVCPAPTLYVPLMPFSVYNVAVTPEPQVLVYVIVTGAAKPPAVPVLVTTPDEFTDASEILLLVHVPVPPPENAKVDDVHIVPVAGIMATGNAVTVAVVVAVMLQVLTGSLDTTKVYTCTDGVAETEDTVALCVAAVKEFGPVQE